MPLIVTAVPSIPVALLDIVGIIAIPVRNFPTLWTQQLCEHFWIHALAVVAIIIPAGVVIVAAISPIPFTVLDIADIIAIIISNQLRVWACDCA